MPVRIRITLVFALLVFLILGLVCSGIYYFSYTSRIDSMKRRLTNRSVTTARLLSKQEIFDRSLIQRIDSFTTIALKNKVVQAYGPMDKKIYSYSDVPGDSLQLDAATLSKARTNGSYYFTEGAKEAVAYFYADPDISMVMVSAAEDEQGKKSLASLLNILLASFLIGVIIILVVGYFFSGGLLQPIKKITTDVEEISAQNLARRINTGAARDDWHHLSTTLNSLLDRLQEIFELQRRFISNASHELSTPLTSISSQLEVYLQRPRDAEDYRKVMQSVYQDVQHMSKLTQTLLEFAKASGNAGGLDINLLRIDEIVLRIPAEVAKNQAGYAVSLRFIDLPEDEEKLLVFGNETLLLSAIKNIAVNACKYSSDHHAFIELEAEDNSVIIVIKDRGKGIPPEELAHIFQPFYRVEESRTTGGFGLGLSLADRIIKLHKGEIKVSSVVNQGTSFTLRLPAASALKAL